MGRKILLLVLAVIAMCSSLRVVCANAARQPAALFPPVVRQQADAAHSAYMAHDYAQAVNHYKQAVELSRGLPPKPRIVLYSNLGAALRECHDEMQAEKAFKQAIELAERNRLESSPACVTAMHQYAMLLRKQKHIVDADLLDARASGVPAGGISPGLLAIMPGNSENTGGDGKSDPAGAGSGSAGALADGSGGVSGANSGDREDDSGWDSMIKQLNSRSGTSLADLHNAAVTQLKQSNWPMAVSLYQQIRSQYRQEFESMHGEYGYCLAKLGRYDDAVEEGRLAINSRPDEPSNYNLLSSYLIEAGDVRGAIDTDRQFLAKFPNDPNYSKVADRMKSLQVDLDRRVAEHQQTDTASKPLDSEVVRRWSRGMMPLKVYMPSDEGVALAPSHSGLTSHNMHEIVLASLDAWTQASQGRCEFMVVQRPEESNIEFAYTNDPSGMENSAQLGVTSWSGENTHMKARIRLLTGNAMGKPSSLDLLMQTTLHELGHALGLEHSNTAGDVMYPSARAVPVTELTNNDTRRIVNIYSAGSW
jgi:Flp pilus assembly protein TadD